MQKAKRIQPSDQSEKKNAEWWNWVFGVFGFVAGLIGILSPLLLESVPTEMKPAVSGAGVVIISLTLLYLFRQKIVKAREGVYNRLESFVPWLIAGGFLLSFFTLLLGISTYYKVLPPEKPLPAKIENTVTIRFDPAKGAIFNSWENQFPQTRFISASGQQDKLVWGCDEYDTPYFSYTIDPTVQPSDPNASSGGYMTFYGKPFDRLSYHEINFKFMVTNAEGQPDVGVRLAVDDPQAPGDRERVTYELPSLKPYFRGQIPLNGIWLTLNVDISHFKQKRFQPPLPEGISENGINKLVFFVNNDIVKNCPKGTLWFRDIVFSK